MKGHVFIVGAGPGDPGLLTLAAVDALKRAEVVIYDRLVSDDILQLIPTDSIKIYAGKPVGSKSVQDEINRLMASEAKRGKNVVRLKGGDPFIFGRGGEEAVWLKRNGVDFEVVPGVTSALGAPAYAGIPLTHRDHSSSVAIVTGHEDPRKPERRVRWSSLATSVDTIVILMGVATIRRIAKRLIRGGMSSQTPLAIIERATTSRQVVRVFSLGEVAESETSKDFRAPSVIVVGEVAAFASELGWLREEVSPGTRYTQPANVSSPGRAGRHRR